MSGEEARPGNKSLAGSGAVGGHGSPTPPPSSTEEEAIDLALVVV
jgi:hypothetical protein